MISPLLAYLILLAAHWLGDFVLQTHWQAQNKSKDWRALLRHVMTYTICLAVIGLVLFDRGPPWGAFVLGNGALHYATDHFTSRWSSRLYARQDWHNFFVMIGLDQLIHQITLAVTMRLAFYQ